MMGNQVSIATESLGKFTTAGTPVFFLLPAFEPQDVECQMNTRQIVGRIKTTQ